jgi:hypothetical protein
MLTEDNKLTKTFMKPLNKLTCLLFIFILTISLAGSVQATTESLNVQGGKDFVRTIDLKAEDQIRLTFTALGQASSPLHFWMVFPNATTKDYGETTQGTISFTSDVKGSCELHFDNSNSSDTQLVTLNYEIEHFIFGIPQIPFLLIVITCFLLCIAAGYIIMGKYS